MAADARERKPDEQDRCCTGRAEGPHAPGPVERLRQGRGAARKDRRAAQALRFGRFSANALVIADLHNPYYTAFADELLQVLDRHPALTGRKVALVTDFVQVRPYPQHYFVSGVPINPAALKQANISAAALILVLYKIRFKKAHLKTNQTG